MDELDEDFWEAVSNADEWIGKSLKVAESYDGSWEAVAGMAALAAAYAAIAQAYAIRMTVSDAP